MSDNLSRRKFLRTGLTAAAVAGTGSLGLMSFQQNRDERQASGWPYPYVQLDKARVMNLAHSGYWAKGCSYGAFHAIIAALAERIGAPYTDFPTEMLIYGKGGGVEYGMICGALNGAIAAINLVTKNWQNIVHDLIGWYGHTLFPTDESNHMALNNLFDTKKYNETLVQSISGSPLCHVSVTKWCNASGLAAKSVYQKERCGRITADCAGKAVELLNADLEGSFLKEFHPSEETESCLSCHGVKATMKNVSAEMECVQCHGIPHSAARNASKK